MAKRETDTELFIQKCKYVDSGWAWLVLFGSSMSNLVIWGYSSSIGILYVEIERTFEVDATTVSWIGSLSSGLMLIGVPLFSPLTVSHGCRKICISGALLASISLSAGLLANSILYVYVCVGILPGIGMAMINSSATLISNSYFIKRKAFALSMNMVMAGIGNTFYGYLQTMLIQRYGFNGTLLMNGAVYFHVVLFGTLFFQNIRLEKIQKKMELNKTPSVYGTIDKLDGNQSEKSFLSVYKEYADVKLWRSNGFLSLITSYFLFDYGFMTVYIFLPSFLYNKGILFNQLPFYNALIGIASTLNRICITGCVTRFQSVMNKVTVGYLVTMAAFIAGIAFSSERFGFFITCAGHGLASGPLICLFPVLLNDVVGPEKLPVGYGVLCFASGFASFTCTLGSNIFTATPDLAFHVASGFSLLSAIVLLYGIRKFTASSSTNTGNDRMGT